MDVTRCGKNFANINIYQLGKTTYWGATSGTNVTLNNDQNFAVLAFKLPTGSFKLVCNNPNIYKITRGITTKYSTIDLNVHYNAFIGYRNYSWGSYSPYQLYNDTIIIDGDADAILLQVKMVENNVPITSSLLEHLQISCVMISENDEYIAYSGTTIPFDWSSTAGILYGGYIDLVTGNIYNQFNCVDMGTLNWNYTNGRFYAPISDALIGSDNNYLSSAVCDIYPTVTYNDIIRNGIKGIAINNSAYIRVYDDHSTIEDFTNAIDGHILVYPLATPVLLTTLTPAQLKSLKGVNNIWSDTNGNVEVSYWTH